MARTMIVPLFIPHQGCHNECIFCNQRKIAGNYDLPAEGLMAELVDQYRESYGNLEGVHVQVAFYGGSFTGLNTELQERLLEEAKELKEQKLIDHIRLSTRPDYIDELVIRRLKQYTVDIVELGVQSLDPAVLQASKRGHDCNDVIQAVKLLRESGLTIGIQLMVGLPEDSLVKSIVAAQKVIELKPDFVRIYPTVVIGDTQLEKMWESGDYQPLTLEEAIKRCSEQMILFDQANIPIVRIGLQATEGLDDGDCLAGPYHPAFGELVKGRVFRKQLEMLLQDCRIIGGEKSTIYCNSSELSQVSGQKKGNLHYFKERGIELSLIGEANRNRGALALERCGTEVVLTKKDFLDRYETIGV